MGTTAPQNIPRCIEGDCSQCKNARGMGDGNDQPQQKCMTCGSLRSHQICGDDRLAVSRLHGVQGAQPHGYERSSQQEPQTHLPCCDELSKAIARSPPTVCLERHGRSGRQLRGVRSPCCSMQMDGYGLFPVCWFGSVFTRNGREVRRRCACRPRDSACCCCVALPCGLRRHRNGDAEGRCQVLWRTVQHIGSIVAQSAAAVRAGRRRSQQQRRWSMDDNLLPPGAAGELLST